MKKFITLVLLQSCAALNLVVASSIEHGDPAMYSGASSDKKPETVKYNLGNFWGNQTIDVDARPHVISHSLGSAPKNSQPNQKPLGQDSATWSREPLKVAGSNKQLIGSDPATWAPAASADDVLKKLDANRRNLFGEHAEFFKSPDIVQRIYDAIKAEYNDTDKRYFENILRRSLTIDPSAKYLVEMPSVQIFRQEKVANLEELLSALSEARKAVILHYTSDKKDINWQQLYLALANDKKTTDWIKGLIQDAQSKAA